MSNYFNPLNTSYLESLQKEFEANPQQLDSSWRHFFSGFEYANKLSSNGTGQDKAVAQDKFQFELKVLELIHAYRELGYLIADVNPLHRGEKKHPLLNLEKFGLKKSDLETEYEVGQIIGLPRAPLNKIIEKLKRIYCASASVEYGHIDDPQCFTWMKEKIESNYLSQPLNVELKKQILKKLIEAEAFETFLHKRFVGHKRFSVEGCDTIIPMLDLLIESSGGYGVNEIILGMAHRGRLNVLANIFSKDMNKILGEFSGHLNANVGDGDVKYHMGYSHNRKTNDGKTLHLSLLPNPSHLESICPVLMGVTRAKQIMKQDQAKNGTIPILLHGDASFAGQGVIYELLNLSDLPGYSVGGTIHIILNNQIGYTTSPRESRSTPQATDVATMMEFPIFHVNGDDPEKAMRCLSLALEFRFKFKKDVVIDLVGYRRYGHNEGDEPSYTQPLLYKTIKQHPRVLEIYRNQLLEAGVIQASEVETIEQKYTQGLEKALEQSRKRKVSPMMDSFGDHWKGLQKPTPAQVFKEVDSGVPLKKLQKIGLKLTQVTDGFHVHPKLKKVLESRQEILKNTGEIDWSFAEALAFASILEDGCRVRLAGQDSERGTFSQRHSVYHDVENGEKFNPYNHLSKKQGKFEVINSPLSEYAALGFEFGQSQANPEQLFLWEAQFGDFINGAQIIVDQYLISSAFKWNRFSGLVLLLPHGYEGQGPEHSSAKLDRFLKACAQNNIQVCNLTTPAQYFHVLRRQVLRKFRIPLILMTPKSLLRSPVAVSSLEKLQNECFYEVLDDDEVSPKAEVNRVIFCSGKIYYELLEERKSFRKNKKIAIVRLEQIYPFPEAALSKILKSYRNAQTVVWCQEGPKNMEAWGFIHEYLPPLLKKTQKLLYAGRHAQASPADSYLHIHKQEQKRIIREALGVKS